MTNGELRIDDPARVRALAHPTRLALLDALGQSAESTATECAERVGESVASCSFHLRMLQKYGFVERGEPRGREKPWKLVSRSWSTPPNPAIQGSVPAVAALADMIVLRETERLRTFLAQSAGDDAAEWIEATTISTATFWATADELRSLRSVLTELAERFAGRNEDPSLRPADARPAHLFATINPDSTAVER